MESLLGVASKALIIVFLLSTMISIGLEVTLKEIMLAASNKRLFIKALVANFILVPFLGLGIARILPMPMNIETGFLLLAAAPGALFAINFTRRTQDSVPFAAALLFSLTVLSIVVTPFLAQLLLNVDQPVTLHYDRAVQVLFLYVLVPLLAGLALNRWANPMALRLRKPLSACAGVSFVLVTVLTMGLKSAATKQIGMNGLLAMLLLIAASMVIGWMLGGPDRGTRRVLTVNTSMRNVALALAIASRSFPGADVDVGVLAFSALMLPPNVLFTIYQSRKMKKLVAHTQSATAK
jgi:BASS family bile acid:Na+ symporter